MKAANHPIPTIKRSLQTYPSIFPNVYRVLEHTFLTNGNGYEVDGDGNLSGCDERKERICITDEGLKCLCYDLIKCDFYAVYPINSFEYEEKHKLSEHRYFTDLYAYPAMNAEWQRAARWFLCQLLNRPNTWWKKHYNAHAMNPATNEMGADYKRYYRDMVTTRKHLAAFVKKKGIKLDDYEAMKWEQEMLGALNPEMAKR